MSAAQLADEAQDEPQRATMGRPTDYSPELAERICELLATTPRGLDYICNKHSSLPSPRAIANWLNRFPDFVQSYVRARERQADLLFDECLSIADDGTNDTYEDAKGNMRVNTEVVQRSRLRVETRMRMAGKLNPKKYGDRSEVSVTGQIDHVHTLAEDVRTKLADKKRASLMARALEVEAVRLPARESQ